MSPSKVTLETGTTALTSLRCFAITCITATEFATLTGLRGDSLSGVSFPAGLTLYGNFTEVTLTSGSVLIYEVPQ